MQRWHFLANSLSITMRPFKGFVSCAMDFRRPEHFGILYYSMIPDRGTLSATIEKTRFIFSRITERKSR